MVVVKWNHQRYIFPLILFSNCYVSASRPEFRDHHLPKPLLCRGECLENDISYIVFSAKHIRKRRLVTKEDLQNPLHAPVQRSVHAFEVRDINLLP